MEESLPQNIDTISHYIEVLLPAQCSQHFLLLFQDFKTRRVFWKYFTTNLNHLLCMPGNISPRMKPVLGMGPVHWSWMVIWGSILGMETLECGHWFIYSASEVKRLCRLWCCQFKLHSVRRLSLRGAQEAGMIAAQKTINCVTFEVLIFKHFFRNKCFARILKVNMKKG